MTVRTLAIDLRRSCLRFMSDDGRKRKVIWRGLRGIGATYILVSFDAAPPAIFWTRREPSSVFNSLSCFLRSSLFLDQSWPLLTLALVDYTRSVDYP